MKDAIIHDLYKLNHILDDPKYDSGITFDIFLSLISLNLGNLENPEGIGKLFDLMDHDKNVK